MAKEIKFSIKLNVDGKEQLVFATTTTKQLQDVVQGAQTAADKLRNSLISINQGFEIIGNLTSAARGLCDQFTELSRQAMAITQVTGATGEEMQNLRTEVQSVATYYGKDFAEVLRSVNALAKGFGISAGDAMRLVRDGFAAGADAGGDFLDTMSEYPRYFKEAGLSAEDFIAISTNAARQGVFSDKGVDAIKEANIRLREMLNPSVDASLGVVHFEVEGRKLVGVMTNETRNGPFHPPERPVWPAVTRRFTLRNGTGPQPVVCQQVAHKPSFGGTPRSSHGSAALQARLSNRFQAARKCKRKIKMACPLRNADKICTFAK